MKSHHERYDGLGYPDGIAGTDIPLEARIMGVADSFDAMTTDRPYRKAMSREEAIIEIQKNTGTQFCPEISDIFISLVNTISDERFDHIRSGLNELEELEELEEEDDIDTIINDM